MLLTENEKKLLLLEFTYRNPIGYKINDHLTVVDYKQQGSASFLPSSQIGKYLTIHDQRNNKFYTLRINGHTNNFKKAEDRNKKIRLVQLKRNAYNNVLPDVVTSADNEIEYRQLNNACTDDPITNEVILHLIDSPNLKNNYNNFMNQYSDVPIINNNQQIQSKSVSDIIKLNNDKLINNQNNQNINTGAVNQPNNNVSLITFKNESDFLKNIRNYIMTGQLSDMTPNDKYRFEVYKDAISKANTIDLKNKLLRNIYRRDNKNIRAKQNRLSRLNQMTELLSLLQPKHKYVLYEMIDPLLESSGQEQVTQDEMDNAEELMDKYDVQSPLQPHQVKALSKLAKGNLIIMHGMGQGKSMTAIAGANAYSKNPLFLVPAPLVGNFEDEIKKHSPDKNYRVVSLPTSVSRNIPILADYVVIDEAHSQRNPHSQRYQYLKHNIPKNARLAIMTGTPMYNEPANIAPLVNLARMKKVLPDDPTEFNKGFIETEKINPGFLQSLVGVKPGEVRHLTNKRYLGSAIRGIIDYYEGGTGPDFPKRIEQIFNVELSGEQLKMYNYLLGRLPLWARIKIKSNLPPSKKESQYLNAFMTGLRQVSLSLYSYDKTLTPLEAAQKQIKLMEAGKMLKQYLNAKGKRAFVYSNYITAGLIPYQALLNSMGFTQAIFDGQLQKQERQQIVHDYNDGKLQVILGGPQSCEGLNLKETTVVQILDPHFNSQRIEQAVARGIRYKSHQNLPPEERKVYVQFFVQKLPKTGFIFKSEPTSNDTYLRTRSEEKDRLQKEMIDIIRKNNK